MTPPTPVFRFAPSPTGELHIGHARSAMIGWRWAERTGGRFLLRIEDIDTGRARAHFTRQIFDDLAWLGLTWEVPALVQSQHFARYQAAARRLADLGLVYPCFATRSEIANAVAATAADPPNRCDPDGAPLYPGLHRHLSQADIDRRIAAGEPFALRLDMARASAAAARITSGAPITFSALDAAGDAREVTARPERWGDAVIVRKDVPASYHLAVVVDDAHQGVTHVTRGTDLEAATDLHRLLQVLLGLPPPAYHHHPLILGADGRKLSKSLGAPSLRSLRESGCSPADVIAFIDDPAGCPTV